MLVFRGFPAFLEKRRKNNLVLVLTRWNTPAIIKPCSAMEAQNLTYRTTMKTTESIEIEQNLFADSPLLNCREAIEAEIEKVKTLLPED